MLKVTGRPSTQSRPQTLRVFECYIAVVANPDKSNGYEEIASIFISGRGRNHGGIGASVVSDWSQMLPDCATVLDLGCGTGVSISLALIQRGFNVYGVDDSPTMVTAFRARFPAVPVECAAVEDSDFFGRTFDAVVAWGLFFLLDAGIQRRMHVHHSADEQFYVLEGMVSKWIDGGWHDLSPGSLGVVPRGTPHPYGKPYKTGDSLLKLRKSRRL